MRTVEEQKIEELNKRKTPIVAIDESLDKYDNVILFPEKQAKCNEILKAAGHPKDAKVKHKV
jgi:hypothetical protein